VKFSLRLNNDVTVDQFVEVARTAERYGFDQLWVSNDLFLRSAPVMLAAAAMHTERLHLGSGVLNPYSIHPAEIAMLAAGLQEMSGGRFLLGLAAGAEDFLHWAGLERPAPLQHTRGAVLAIRSLLSGERPFDEAGIRNGWTEEAYLRFSAIPAPIYIGALSPKMQAMAGELADGVLPLLFPPEHYPIAMENVAAGADRAGRSMADIDLAACVWVSIGSDAEQAQRLLAEKIVYYGPSISPTLLNGLGLEPDDFDGIKSAMAAGDVSGAVAQVTDSMLRLGIAGNADDVRQRCEWLVEAGARHLSFGPPLGPEPLAAIWALGENVLPAFR
jgi:5,10-methylenetetrahydromethanopterin reductase